MTPDPYILTPEDRIAIRGALAEIDPRQIEIDRRLTPAQRVRKALSVIEAARRFAIYRLRQSNPQLSEVEVQRIWLARYYELEARSYVRR